MALKWQITSGVAAASLLYVLAVSTDKVDFPNNFEVFTVQNSGSSNGISNGKLEGQGLVGAPYKDSQNQPSSDPVAPSESSISQPRESSSKSSPPATGPSTTSDLKSSTDGRENGEPATANGVLSCRAFINPIGIPSNRSFRLIVTSDDDFTARVSVIWSSKSESLTLDVVNGSGSVILKGDRPIKPEVSISQISDTSTEICAYRSS
jgi:hypothetical protein